MRYIALLRGINVGTSGRIRMDALKRLFEEAGLGNVTTFIQSGNVLFDSLLSESDAKETIERALKEGANISTVAVIRTADELRQIILGAPFTADEISAAQAENAEGESYHVCLLPKEPDAAALRKLNVIDPSIDRFSCIGRTVYLLLRQSIRTSKLALRMQKIFPDMTVRNWNTMSKLSELANPQTGG